MRHNFNVCKCNPYSLELNGRKNPAPPRKSSTMYTCNNTQPESHLQCNLITNDHEKKYLYKKKETPKRTECSKSDTRPQPPSMIPYPSSPFPNPSDYIRDRINNQFPTQSLLNNIIPHTPHLHGNLVRLA